MTALRAALLAVALAPSAALAASDYPFVGSWDCEVATFTFTPTTYHNGSDTMRMRKVDSGKGGYVLRFAKGYAISLMDVTAKTMTWHSLESGDTFRCKRVK